MSFTMTLSIRDDKYGELLTEKVFASSVSLGDLIAIQEDMSHLTPVDKWVVVWEEPGQPPYSQDLFIYGSEAEARGELKQGENKLYRLMEVRDDTHLKH